MKRRALLTTGGVAAFAAVAGVGSSIGPRDGVRSPAVTVEPDPVDSDRDVSIDVTLEREFSEDSPARFTVSLTNTAASERQFTFGLSPPFSAYSPEGASGAYLVPDDTSGWLGESEPDEPSGGCWRAEPVATHLSATLVWLDPGETVRETYSVLSHWSSRRCLPSGEYRFVETDYLGLDWEWGITLTLE